MLYAHCIFPLSLCSCLVFPFFLFLVLLSLLYKCFPQMLIFQDKLNSNFGLQTNNNYALGQTRVAASNGRRKTKIVCTIGPSTSSREMIWKLAEAGMNVARLNMSHGDHASHQKTIDRVKEYNSQFDDKVIAIMLDTKVCCLFLFYSLPPHVVYSLLFCLGKKKKKEN